MRSVWAYSMWQRSGVSVCACRRPGQVWVDGIEPKIVHAAHRDPANRTGHKSNQAWHHEGKLVSCVPSALHPAAAEQALHGADELLHVTWLYSIPVGLGQTPAAPEWASHSISRA